MENREIRCIRCGNFLSEDKFCAFDCVEKEIKEIRKYLLVSTMFGTVFVSLLLAAFGQSVVIRTPQDMIWSVMLYLFVFTLPFGRRNASAGLRISNSTSFFGGGRLGGFINFNGSEQDSLPKAATEIISITLAGFVSYLGILNLPYKLFRLLKLARVRRSIVQN